MKKKKILIVDDEEDLLDFIAMVLSDENYITYKAKNVNEALSILQNNKVDLILLDIMLPEIDGFSFNNMLRSDDELRNIPVAFITARLDSQDKIIGLKEGAVDYICKPFTSDELVNRVKQIFRKVEDG
uniref:Response regulator n=1 Tax=candidate division WOR-3 bacterium TaxID=2052148 RepID=A0A7C4Y4F6_UNCW3